MTLNSHILSSQTKDKVTDAAIDSDKLCTAFCDMLCLEALFVAEKHLIADGIIKVGFRNQKGQSVPSNRWRLQFDRSPIQVHKEGSTSLRDKFDLRWPNVPITFDKLCSLPSLGRASGPQTGFSVHD